MARHAIISDVHAHLDALQAVLRDIDNSGLDDIWFLGDAVGYGPEPNEVVSLLRECAAFRVPGNHDWLATRGLRMNELREHSRAAWESGTWTRAQLNGDVAQDLAGLPLSVVAGAAELFHAAPWSLTQYLSDAFDVSWAMREAPKGVRLLLAGHTHLPAFWTSVPADEELGGFVAVEHEVRYDKPLPLGSRFTFANPGSVAFRRDGTPHATWLIWDDAADTLIWRRTEVDHTRTRALIAASDGLPDILAA